MTALDAFSLVVALVVMVTVAVVALIGMGLLFGKLSGGQASIEQFNASLVKHLPPEVQADMKSGQFGRVTSVAIAVVVLPVLVAGLITIGKAREVFFVRFGGILLAVVSAVWTASIARNWLDRRNPGEVLADLSPYPLAGAVRRRSWLGWWVMVADGLILPILQSASEGYLLVLAFWVAFVLLGLLTNLMYLDRVWLAERGLYFGGWLYPWDGFERVAWTDDRRAFALPRKGRWLFQRWTVVPVPEGSREAAEEALRQVMPTPTLARFHHRAIEHAGVAQEFLGRGQE